jgi:hypothetical protein
MNLTPSVPPLPTSAVDETHTIQMVVQPNTQDKLLEEKEAVVENQSTPMSVALVSRQLTCRTDELSNRDKLIRLLCFGSGTFVDELREFVATSLQNYKLIIDIGAGSECALQHCVPGGNAVISVDICYEHPFGSLQVNALPELYINPVFRKLTEYNAVLSMPNTSDRTPTAESWDEQAIKCLRICCGKKVERLLVITGHHTTRVSGSDGLFSELEEHWVMEQVIVRRRYVVVQGQRCIISYQCAIYHQRR